MNEREIRALIREAEAAAKRYKAELNAKSLSKMTPAEIKASEAVLKNKKAITARKLQDKNTAIVNKIKGGGGLRGGLLGGGGFPNDYNK